ncbi:sensor histidine kinase [Flavobacterium wongokense]|uniref:sensor histidine kinase n=1 Tax=Flavobacterium wongokense TaxID=2910674 RepID=UPI001F35E733|nr:ATP-binding protein [Flavobacterium sp. WG47]MCF6130940.1 histidine kinase [Flavobacterium sp. WG47]
MLHNIAIGVLICLLFITIVIIFSAVIIKLYIKKVKEHNFKEIEFQKNLNKAILETQEQVLENISQDLHDDIGQQLTFVNFQLEKIKLGTQDHEELNKLTESVSRVSGSVRDLSHSLNSNFLAQNDLQKAIEKEVTRIKKYGNLNVSFQSSLTNYKFTNTEKIILYRIFQEVTANALKHSDATKIEITMNEKPNFQFIIKDNGKGFNMEETIHKDSLGLINIKSRCEIIDCEFDMNSKINEGTTIIITKKTPQNE